MSTVAAINSAFQSNFKASKKKCFRITLYFRYYLHNIPLEIYMITIINNKFIGCSSSTVSHFKIDFSSELDVSIISMKLLASSCLLT